MTGPLTAKGHCLCGAVSFECTGPARWRLYCHCASCRRNVASPVTAFFGMANENYRWTGKPAAVFHSSPGVRRMFCNQCGTPMAFEADHYPGEIHFYTATLEDSTGFEPTGHVHAGERLHWFDVDDDLPRWRGTMGEDKLDT